MCNRKGEILSQDKGEQELQGWVGYQQDDQGSWELTFEQSPESHTNGESSGDLVG